MSFPQPCLPVSKRIIHHKSHQAKQKAKQQQQAAAPSLSLEDVQNMSADEYLTCVSQQARSLPDVFVSTRPQEGPDDSKTTTNKRRRRHNEDEGFAPIDGCAASLAYLCQSQHSQLVAAPSARHLPTNPHEWVSSIIEQFSRLREYLEHLQSSRAEQQDHQWNRLPVPAMKDRAGWHSFCVGEDAACGNEQSYYHDFDDDVSEDSDVKDKSKNAATPTSLASDAWKSQLPANGYQPEVSLVLQLDQVMTRAVLSHLTCYVKEGWLASHKQRCQWLYALLARLERPLHRNDASTMWSLLQALTQQRASVQFVSEEDKDRRSHDTSRDHVARLNVLIAIIGVYFEQGGFHAVMTTTTSTTSTTTTTTSTT